MSLESEIKKLTDAVTALTVSMQGGQPVQAQMQQPVAQYTPPAVQYTPPAVQYTPPAVQYTPPAAQAQMQQQPVAGMTLADAQRELGGVMQILGAAAGPQMMVLLGQYGNGATTLSAVPVQNLPALVAAAKALVH
jgi:hypothetical protein